MTLFRPCIDLHQGQVKQIVGASLNDQGATTNFVSPHDASFYAKLYQQHQLQGGHVIALGPGNEQQALASLSAYPKGLQFGGGVNLDNAQKYLDAGASQVIVTSYLFENGEFSWPKLKAISKKIGPKQLVLDLSCRRHNNSWYIATDRWQTVTQTEVSASLLQELSQYCNEYLIHAADVEGLQAGIDEQLVSFLGEHSPIATTYAGGARNLDDLARVKALSDGKIDLTIGSALDIFGGTGVTLDECIAWNQQQKT